MRRSVDIPTLHHLAPIPVASRIGPLLTSSVIGPYAPGTRECPESVEQQVENLFLHMQAILEAESATWDQVARMTFFAVDLGAVKDAVNTLWLRTFPDEASRPARNTLVVPPYGGGMMVCCEFQAYLDG